MTRHVPLAAPIAILLGLAVSLPAEEVSPEVQEKIRKLSQEGGFLYQKKEHQKSIEAFQKLLELVPADDGFDPLRMQSHYSIAANYALLKRETEALLHLEKAIENGLTEMAYLEMNKDFTSLRLSKGFAALPAKIRRKAELDRRRRLESLKTFDFSLTALDGKQLRKKDFLGQVLIVDIWGTWCPPCRMEIPHFIELQKRHGGKGLAIVGLNSEQTKDPKEAERKVKRFIEEAKVPYPCAMVTDEILKSIPGFSAFPTTIFFGRDGSPRAIEVGARDLAALEAIVKPLLAEEAPKPAGAPQPPAGGSPPSRT